MIIKRDLIAYSLMGNNPNASILTMEPVLYHPMFGVLGKAVNGAPVTFTSQLAIENGISSEVASKKRLVPVRDCRNIGKKDMLYNDGTPDITVNPETYEVRVDGKLATVNPAKTMSLARLYNLF